MLHDPDGNDVEQFEEEVDEELDEITQLFLTTPDSEDVVLHRPECSINVGGRLCDCTPVTLRRGATA